MQSLFCSIFYSFIITAWAMAVVSAYSSLSCTEDYFCRWRRETASTWNPVVHSMQHAGCRSRCTLINNSFGTKQVLLQPSHFPAFDSSLDWALPWFAVPNAFTNLDTLNFHCGVVKIHNGSNHYRFPLKCNPTTTPTTARTIKMTTKMMQFLHLCFEA